MSSVYPSEIKLISYRLGTCKRFNGRLSAGLADIAGGKGSGKASVPYRAELAGRIDNIRNTAGMFCSFHTVHNHAANRDLAHIGLAAGFTLDERCKQLHILGGNARLRDNRLLCCLNRGCLRLLGCDSCRFFGRLLCFLSCLPCRFFRCLLRFLGRDSCRFLRGLLRFLGRLPFRFLYSLLRFLGCFPCRFFRGLLRLLSCFPCRFFSGLLRLLSRFPCRFFSRGVILSR